MTHKVSRRASRRSDAFAGCQASPGYLKALEKNALLDARKPHAGVIVVTGEFEASALALELFELCLQRLHSLVAEHLVGEQASC